MDGRLKLQFFVGGLAKNCRVLEIEKCNGGEVSPRKLYGGDENIVWV